MNFDGVFSVYGIVSAKSNQILRRYNKLTDQTTWYDWSSLTNRNVSNKYAVNLGNKFDTL